MKKVVLLNSGGFDSIVLTNEYCTLHPEEEVHFLHFLYGARNEKQQLRCVEKVAKKYNCKLEIIQLPKMSWTKSNFFKEGFDYENQYVEYRNLIFISYALSYAQGIGAHQIYMATLHNVSYIDTHPIFFAGINYFSKELSDIEVKTPYGELFKYHLIPKAIDFGVEIGDYFSCDVPRGDNPCGECGDCLSLKSIEDVMKYY